MPYIENENKAKLREIRNIAVPVFDGITNELVHYEVTKEHYYWLLGQVEQSEVEKTEAYQAGYKQGKFDELMDDL